MTDRDLHIAVSTWIADVTSAPAILAYQKGPQPADSYASVALTAIRDLTPEARYTAYSEADGDVTATPLIDVEWQFSVTFWGPDQGTLMHRLRSAMQIKAVMDRFTAASLHELGRANTVPERINDEWVPRTQAPLFVHGVTQDGFVIDTIETVQGTYNGRPFSASRPA